MSSPSPSSTGAPQRPPSTSSTLYLVTFLATLFLLLFVSCAIVLRSYILRRRYQRRLDEAMAAGMLLAPRAQGSKRKRFGAKPRLYDTWLAPTESDPNPVTWSKLMPLSAQPVFVKRKYKEVPKGPQPPASSSPNRQSDSDDILDLPDTSIPTISTRLRHLFQPRTRTEAQAQTQAQNQTQTLYATEADAAVPDTLLVEASTPIIPNSSPSPPLPPSTSTPTSTPAKPTPAVVSYRVRIEMLQVSVLIAMPSQSRSVRYSARKKAKAMAIYDNDDDDEDEDEDDEDEEEELSELVFGVSRINYRQNQAQASPQTQSQTLTAQIETQNQQHRKAPQCVTCGSTVGAGGTQLDVVHEVDEDAHAHEHEHEHAHEGELGENARLHTADADADADPPVVDFGEALRRRQPVVQFVEPSIGER